jgi:two-component system, LytTR family, response regulator
MIRTIIVDDEKPSRDVLCNYLREYCSDVSIVATASSVTSALRAINKFPPDLVFLDIEMPDGTGFELLRKFELINFSVIFVTAYSEYAVKAFRFCAIDYLLKPVKIDELTDAVEKVKLMKWQSPIPSKLTILLNNLDNGFSTIPTLVIPHSSGFDVLKIPEIIMCQADGYCTIFSLQNGKSLMSTKNLKHYELLLAEHNFLRTHNSYLINLNHILKYSNQGEIILSGNNKASLGHLYKKNFIKRFGRK